MTQIFADLLSSAFICVFCRKDFTKLPFAFLLPGTRLAAMVNPFEL
jgi:hypothetical protein